MKEKVIKYTKKNEEGKTVCALKHSLWESELSVVTLELKGLVVDVSQFLRKNLHGIKTLSN